MKFIISLAPSINQTYGVSRTGKQPLYKKKHVRDWEWTAGWEVKQQWKGKHEPLTGKITMIINWYYSRNRDIDSGLKVLLDLFQKQRVYLNDMQVVELVVFKEQDIKNPRTEVQINEVK